MNKKTLKIVYGSILILFFILIIGFSSLVYRAPEVADSVEGYEVVNRHYVFENESSIANIILYPGGLVHPEAYLELGSKLDKCNFNVYIPRMPFHLPILNSDSALDIDVDDTLPTFIGGHSLGGVAASQAVYDYQGHFSGLILLAAYPSEGIDLSDRRIPVLSLTASNDGIMDRETYEASLSRLPQNYFNEVSISGGNHAYFGSYGEQSGDFEASISREVQLEFTTSLIQNFILENLE